MGSQIVGHNLAIEQQQLQASYLAERQIRQKRVASGCMNQLHILRKRGSLDWLVCISKSALGSLGSPLLLNWRAQEGPASPQPVRFLTCQSIT